MDEELDELDDDERLDGDDDLAEDEVRTKEAEQQQAEPKSSKMPTPTSEFDVDGEKEKLSARKHKKPHTHVEAGVASVAMCSMADGMPGPVEFGGSLPRSLLKSWIEIE